MTHRILIVNSPYYAHISKELELGAREALEASGDPVEIETIMVPGAFEVPGAIAMAADSNQWDGYIALGCVIRGDTTHYDYVCGESARGLMTLAVERRLAVGLGILTVEDEAQALIRANRHEKNKGKDAAVACLEMIKLRKKFVR